MLEIQLLKRNRRGQYANGCSNADTFWYALLASARGKQRLSLEYPPPEYYRTEWEPPDTGVNAAKLTGKKRGGHSMAISQTGGSA